MLHFLPAFSVSFVNCMIYQPCAYSDNRCRFPYPSLDWQNQNVLQNVLKMVMHVSDYEQEMGQDTWRLAAIKTYILPLRYTSFLLQHYIQIEFKSVCTLLWLRTAISSHPLHPDTPICPTKMKSCSPFDNFTSARIWSPFPWIWLSYPLPPEAPLA